jgi:hypothetical protein
VVGQREEEEEAEAAGPEEEGPSACLGWPVMANRTCAAAAQHENTMESEGAKVGKGSSSRLPSQDRVLSWNGRGSR